MALNLKQKRFAAEYLRLDHCAKRAYISAYGQQKNEHVAEVSGSRLLSHVEVSNEIQRLWRERERQSLIRSEDVLQGIANIAFSDPRKLINESGELKSLGELDDGTALSLASYELHEDKTGKTRLSKVKGWDKTKALETLAKATGLVGPETHLHAHVSFTAEQFREMTDGQLEKVEGAYATLAEVEHEIKKKG
jgi:phage terminase small subunit